MAISLTRYVDITSGIGAGAVVNQRNLGGMIITNNPLVPTNTLLSLNSAAEALQYFGSGSEEYARALFYFGFTSKSITQANQLSYVFWNNDIATGSLIYGLTGSYTVSQFTGITTGDFTLTLGGYTDHITGINLGSAGSLSAVAADIQTAIRAVSAGGAAWTSATVTYNATTSRFQLVSGTTGTDVISVVAGSIEDVAGPLGWLTGAILSNGTAAETITTVLTNLVNVSNNFGSFCFTTALAPTLSTIEAAANWNLATSPNVLFLFSIAVTSANASTWYAALNTIGGCTATLVSPVSGEYPEMCPMILLGATNYAARNAVQNYMYQQFNLTPSVTTDAAANIYDPLLINYYGVTQTAGQYLAFYQRGVMYGLSTNPSDQNVYANEIWLKDALGAALMTLLLAQTEVPANRTGQSMILGTLQTIVNQALFNGTISVGKTLTTSQQLYITQATGSATAWQQVQNSGYWLNVVIQQIPSSSPVEYEAVYTLIYSKNDVVRFIQGSDVLI